MALSRNTHAVCFLLEMEMDVINSVHGELTHVSFSTLMSNVYVLLTVNYFVLILLILSFPVWKESSGDVLISKGYLATQVTRLKQVSYSLV